MPVITHIDCAHCGKTLRTTRAIAVGTKIRCKECGKSFYILAVGPSLMESIPIEQGLPPRQSSYSDVTPNPTQPSKSPASVKPRRTNGFRGTAFESSRSTVTVFLGLIIVGAVGLFLSWYTDTVNTLDIYARAASQKRKAALQSLVDGKSGQAPSKSKKFTLADPSFTTAPETYQINDWVVGIPGGKLGSVKMVRGRQTKERHLTLQLRITNVGDTPLNYRSWAASPKALVLNDQNRQFYNQIVFQADDPPEGHTPVAAIPPGTTITDVLVFESPINPPLYYQTGWGFSYDFYLELPCPNSSDQVFKFRIPWSIIKQESLLPTTIPEPPLVRELIPPTPTPYDPVQDPRICAEVRSEYNIRWREVVRQSKGMSYDRSRRHKKLSYDRIVSELAQKYEFTESVIRQMIPAY